MAAVAAGPVTGCWEKDFGNLGVSSQSKGIGAGDLAWRQHSGDTRLRQTGRPSWNSPTDTLGLVAGKCELELLSRTSWGAARWKMGHSWRRSEPV